jgi:DNA-binding transcriptional LysR family regulator
VVCSSPVRSLDYKDLEVLAVVVDEGSIRSAALRLDVSEPSISRRLSRLERSLGVPLLERSTRGVVPTSAGRMLLPYIDRGKDLLDEMFAAMNRSSSSTKLTVWTDATLAPFVMSFVCTSLTDLPVEISNRIASADTVRTAILHGSADAAFSAGGSSPESVVSVPFFVDELAYVVHPSHPLASSTGLRVDDLAEHDVAVVDWGPATDQVTAHLYGAGMERARLRLVSPGATAVALARSCDHVGISTRSSVAHELAHGALVELPTTDLPSLEVEVALLYRRSDGDSPGIVALRSAVERAWRAGTIPTA